MNKKIAFSVAALGLALALGLCGCVQDEPPETTGGTAAKKPFSADFGNEVSVHDPSIFKDDDGTYYAFGTHYAVAKSTDLIKWNQVATDGQAEKLFGSKNVAAAMPETCAILGQTGDTPDIWAPDVVKHGDKYYYYYSVTAEFGSNKSVIGRVEADNVLGPYSNNEVIVESVTAPGSHPNAIDPELFEDKDGGLWMVYGSFFAGIYVKELYNDGENYGLPKNPDEGFGTLVWKGVGSGVEGPFVFYNPDTDYYYLMTSDGSLSTNYNMRVARSKSPAGPYTDIAGTEMSSATRGTGNKLAGNYQFASEGRGYAALGHNSVLVEDGKYFVIHHTRYRQGSTGVSGNHNLNVRQLFFNEDGWPCLSPNRYAGETIGTVKEKDIVGDYDVVLHTNKTEDTFVDSEVYSFTSDGKVTAEGTEVGTWELKEAYYITITIDGNVYKGVVAPAWCSYVQKNNKGVFCITAALDDCSALWANPVVVEEEE